MTEKRRYCLQPNMFNWRNVFIPLVAGAAMLALSVGAALLFAKEKTGGFNAVILAGLCGSVAGYLVTRRTVAPRRALQVYDDRVAIVDGKSGRVFAEAPIGEARVGHGYFLVPARFAAGYAPAITVDVPGASRLCIATNDLEHYYYWNGDDPWTRSYGLPKDLPYASHWVTGDDFMSIAQALVKNGTLVQNAVGTRYVSAPGG